MAPSEIIRRLGGSLALSGAMLSLVALYGWWQACATGLDDGLWLGLLLMAAGTLMGGWRHPQQQLRAAGIAPAGLWFAETRARISRTIRYAAIAHIGNDNLVAALPPRRAVGPVVPLSPRKRKPR